MTKLTSSLQILAFSLTLLATQVALANEAATETQTTKSMSHEEGMRTHKEFKAKQKAEKEAFHSMKS